MEPLSLGGWGQGQNSSLWPPSPCMFLVTCCLVCCCQYPGPATVWDTQWLVPRYCADPWVTSRRGHKGKAETGPIVPTADTHTTDMTLIYNTLIVNTHTHTTLATHPHSSVFISWMRMGVPVSLQLAGHCSAGASCQLAEDCHSSFVPTCDTGLS